MRTNNIEQTQMKTKQHTDFETKGKNNKNRQNMEDELGLIDTLLQPKKGNK